MVTYKVTVSFEDTKMEPWAKECRQLLEAENGKEKDFPL